MIRAMSPTLMYNTLLTITSKFIIHSVLRIVEQGPRSCRMSMTRAMPFSASKPVSLTILHRSVIGAESHHPARNFYFSTRTSRYWTRVRLCALKIWWQAQPKHWIASSETSSTLPSLRNVRTTQNSRISLSTPTLTLMWATYLTQHTLRSAVISLSSVACSINR